MTGAVKLNTAGGGSVLVQPASSIASDVTVNVPSQNCTLGIQGPAFSAYLSTGQFVSNQTWTKVALSTEDFDTANCFDSTTNYRFSPNVAGYYQINIVFSAGSSSYSTEAITALYKNGSSYRIGRNSYLTEIINTGGPTICAIVYLNGTTDYVEMYGYISASSGPAFSGVNVAPTTYMSGALVRAA